MDKPMTDEQGRPEWDGGDFEEKQALLNEAAAEETPEERKEKM